MERRRLLVCCAVSTVAGCLEGLGTPEEDPNNATDGGGNYNHSNNDTMTDEENKESSNNDSMIDEENDDSYGETYFLDVRSAEKSIGDDEEFCEFEDLSEEIQTEVEKVIMEGEYSTKEKPELIDSDCFREYIKYEDKYYIIGASVNG